MIVYGQVNSRGWCEWDSYSLRNLERRKGGRPIDRDLCDSIVKALESCDKPIQRGRLVQMVVQNETESSTRNIIQSLTYYEPRLFESDDGRIGLLGVHDD